MSKYPKVNYIGNKTKLADWIIEELPINQGTVLDIFSGGASVSYALKKAGFNVISNDILYSNYVIAKAIVENNNTTLSEDVFNTYIDEDTYNSIRENVNFLSSNLYFEYEVDELAKLVSISRQLENYERYLFLALLRRAMIRKLPYSRMNVPWNNIKLLRDEDYSYKKYGRKRAYHNLSFEHHMKTDLKNYNNSIFTTSAQCNVYNLDAMEVIDEIDFVDLVYIDPPYPSTMNNYDSFYGSFDIIFNRQKNHIDFTKQVNFNENLKKLVHKLQNKTNYVAISLNTNTKPCYTEIIKLLEDYGTVDVKEKNHVYKVTGKENKNITNELLIILTFNPQ